MSKEWPQPSSPGVPPKCGVYFSRLIAGVAQDVIYRGFVNVWQLGLWARVALGDGELVSASEDDQEIVYLKWVDRPLESRTYWVKLVGCGYREAMKASAGRTRVEIPFPESKWLAALNGETVEVKGRDAEAREVVVNVDKSSARVVAPRGARAVGVSVGVLCAEAGVDAKDVRRELRKRDVEKGVGGWSFAEGSKALATVVEVIKFVKRKSGGR
jgi:hypothetical protein